MSGGREGTYYFLSTATVKVSVVTLDGQPTETQLHVLVCCVYTIKSGLVIELCSMVLYVWRE